MKTFEGDEQSRRMMAMERRAEDVTLHDSGSFRSSANAGIAANALACFLFPGIEISASSSSKGCQHEGAPSCMRRVAARSAPAVASTLIAVQQQVQVERARRIGERFDSRAMAVASIF
jgi:hypothetical protein